MQLILQGFYEGSSKNKSSQPLEKNVTFCSQPVAFFSFDITEIIQRELNPHFKLIDLRWTDNIKGSPTNIKIASTLMLVFYCAGIILTGCALINATFKVWLLRKVTLTIVLVGQDSNIETQQLIFSCQLAIIFLVAASIIAAYIIGKIESTVNKYGNKIGLVVQAGSTFLIATWFTVGLMMLEFFLRFRELNLKFNWNWRKVRKLGIESRVKPEMKDSL